MASIETFRNSLAGAAEDLAGELRRRELKIVFAESCTAGLLSFSLSQIPGISQYLCGGMVTYRNTSKNLWLKVSESDLNSPEIGPVSETVARQMATGILRNTPEADVAVSVTGHLGPDAPAGLDGIAWMAMETENQNETFVRMLTLTGDTPEDGSLRATRQIDAAQQVLQAVLENL